MPSLYSGNSNTAVSGGNTVGLYGTGGNVYVLNNAQQVYQLLSNSGNVVFSLIQGNTLIAANVTFAEYSNANVAAYLAANPPVGNYGNANVAAYLPTDSTIIAIEGNITSLFSNASTQQAEIDAVESNITTLFYNDTVRQQQITVLQGNVATLESNASSQQALIVNNAANISTLQSCVSTMFSNASSQQAEIDAVEANVLILQGNVATLQSNTSSQQAEIDAVEANVLILQGNVTTLFSNASNQQALISNITSNVTTLQTNVATLQGQVYSNANVAGYLPTYTGNIAGQYGNFSANVSANYFTGNGSLLTGISVSSNVTLTGNVTGSGTTGNNINTTIANSGVVAGTYGSSTYVGRFTVSDDGRITSATDVAISGGGGSYGDANVAAYLPLNTANVSGDKFHGNLFASNGNVTGNNFVANYFIGDGSQLTNLPVQSGTYSNTNVANYLVANPQPGTYSNTNVASYLPTYTGNISGTLITAAQPNVTSVGTLTGVTINGVANIIDTTNATGINTGALIVAGGASFAKDVWIQGNLNVTNIYSINSNILEVDHPLVYLQASPTYPYNYDIGFYSHFTGGPSNIYQHTGLVRDYSSNTWLFFSNVANEPSGNVINTSTANIVYDAVRMGNLTSNIVTANSFVGEGYNISKVDKLAMYVHNADSVTITKGQPVYAYGAQGDLVSVKLANASQDATSARTLGLALENITNATAGWISTQGELYGVDTSAYTAGDTLYLGSTAGTLSNVKPKAPTHLVYIGVVARANAGNGLIYVKPQNGYELEEIHDVNITTPTSGQTIIYNATTDLWYNQTMDTGNVTEGANLYYTNARARAAISYSAGVAGYNSSTGVISIPDNTTQLTNGNSFITLGSLSGAGSVSYDNTTGVITGTYSNTNVANYLVANPQPGTYSNTNVAAYLPTYTGNIAGQYGNFTANVSGVYILGDGSLLTNLPVQSGTYGDSNVASYLTANPQPGTYSNTNVANYLVANPQPGTYSNTNVAAYLPTYTGNVTGQYANLTANVSATYFVGNGALLTGISSGGIANVYADPAPKLSASLDLNGQSLTTSASSNININTSGTGRVNLGANTVMIGQGVTNAAVTITSNGNNSVTISTNNSAAGGPGVALTGGTSGLLLLASGTTGSLYLTSNTILAGNLGAVTTTSYGAFNYTLTTNSGTNAGNIVLQQGTNANIVITPNGTGKSLIYRPVPVETLYSIGTTSGTITPNAMNGSVQTLTLNGNLTWNAFTSPVAGQSITMIIKQDATGNRTLTSTGIKWAGGSKTLSTAANSIDIATVYYDGTNYWGSLSTGFV